MIPYIKTAFTNPKEIYIGRNMKWRHFFYIVLLTSGLLTFISLFQYIPMLNNISDDFLEIKESIPAFELENNEINSENDSYIYQTDSMMFYFDPDNRMDIETIDRNANRTNAPVSTAILKDGLYMNFIGQGYHFSYSQMDHVTTSDLESLISSFGDLSATTFLIFILVVFIMQFFLFIYELIPLTFMAAIISAFSRLRLSLFQNYRIVLLAVIPPTILVNIVHTIIFPLSFQFEIIMVMSILTYYISISDLKKKLLQNKDLDE